MCHRFPPLNFIHLQTYCAAVCYLGRDGPIPYYSQVCYVWVRKCLGGWEEPCAFNKLCTVYITYWYDCMRSVMLCRAFPLEVWYALDDKIFQELLWPIFVDDYERMTSEHETRSIAKRHFLNRSLISFLL